MKDFLDERISELRQRYRETSDIRWQHRYNEAMLIRERLIVRQIEREQDSGQRERRTVLPPEHPDAGPDSNR